jgi:hypothetical protein
VLGKSKQELQLFSLSWAHTHCFWVLILGSWWRITSGFVEDTASISPISSNHAESTATWLTVVKTPLLSELPKNASGIELHIVTNCAPSNYLITITPNYKVSSLNYSLYMEL